MYLIHYCNYTCISDGKNISAVKIQNLLLLGYINKSSLQTTNLDLSGRRRLGEGGEPSEVRGNGS